MKFATVANTVTAALIAAAAMLLTRTVDQLDTVAERVQDLEVRVAVLEAKQP